MPMPRENCSVAEKSLALRVEVKNSAGNFAPFGSLCL
jgi:hypothetical protein